MEAWQSRTDMMNMASTTDLMHLDVGLQCIMLALITCLPLSADRRPHCRLPHVRALPCIGPRALTYRAV